MPLTQAAPHSVKRGYTALILIRMCTLKLNLHASLPLLCDDNGEKNTGIEDWHVVYLFFCLLLSKQLTLMKKMVLVFVSNTLKQQTETVALTKSVFGQFGSSSSNSRLLPHGVVITFV